jgi:hypothetical protein
MGMRRGWRRDRVWLGRMRKSPWMGMRRMRIGGRE